MNPEQQIERRLEAMPEQMASLKIKGRHYLKYRSNVDMGEKSTLDIDLGLLHSTMP